MWRTLWVFAILVVSGLALIPTRPPLQTVPRYIGISTKNFDVVGLNSFETNTTYEVTLFKQLESTTVTCPAVSEARISCELDTSPFLPLDNVSGYHFVRLYGQFPGEGTVTSTTSYYLSYVHEESYEIASYNSSDGEKNTTSLYDIAGGEELVLYVTGHVFESEALSVKFNSTEFDYVVEQSAEFDYVDSILIVKVQTPPWQKPAYFDNMCIHSQEQGNSSCILHGEMTISFDGTYFSQVPLPIAFSYFPPLSTSFIFPGGIPEFGFTFKLNSGREKMEDELGASIDASTIFENVIEGDHDIKQSNKGNTSLTETPVNQEHSDGTPNAYYQAFSLMRSLCMNGADLIFTCSAGYEQQTVDISQTLECKTSQTKFVNIGGTATSSTVSAAYAKIYQMRYLSGIVAAKDLQKRKTEFETANPSLNYTRDCIGYIATSPSPEVQRNINALIVGCKSHYAECVVKVLWLGNSPSSSLQEDAAAFLWNVGQCDILTLHTDAVEPQLYYANRGGSILGFGNDMRALVGDAILTTMVFNWEVVFKYFAENMLNDMWTEEFFFPGSAEGAVDLSLFSSRVSTSTREIVLTEKAMIDAAEGILAYRSIFCGPLRAHYRYQRAENGTIFVDFRGNPRWEKLDTPEQINTKHYIDETFTMLETGDPISESDCLWGSSLSNAGQAIIGDAFPEPFDSDKIFNDYLLEGVELFDEEATIYGSISSSDDVNSSTSPGFFEPIQTYPLCDGTQWTRAREECDLLTLTTPISYELVTDSSGLLLCGIQVNNETGKILEPEDPPFIPPGESAPRCDYLPVGSGYGVLNIFTITFNATLQFALLIGITYYRNRRQVVATQPILLLLMLVMGLILTLSFLMLLGEPTDNICLARIWIMNISFDFMFAILFAKDYRILMLYRYAKNMRSVQLSSKDMIILAIYICLVDIAVLALWTVSDRPIVRSIELDLNIPEGVGTLSRLECASSSEVYLSVVLFYKMLLVLSNCTIVYSLRKIPKMLKEFVPFRAILISSYMTAIFLSVVLLLSKIMEDIISRYTIYIIGGSIGTTVLVGALSIPPILGAYFHQKQQTEILRRMTSVHDETITATNTSTEQVEPRNNVSMISASSFGVENYSVYQADATGRS